LEKKSSSFGYGKRTDIAEKSKDTIDPGAYNIPSTFESKRRGFSFGSSRNEIKFQNYLKMLGNSSTNVFYTIDNSTLYKGKSFSIKERTGYPANCTFVFNPDFLPNNPETERRSRLPSPASY
jgi:hypothetical protein